MEVSGQFHAPATLPPGKVPRYSLDRRLGGPQSRSGRGDEGKNVEICVPIRLLLYIIRPNGTNSDTGDVLFLNYGINHANCVI
jgi:hypothetical protein